ncbi:hypothetical protein Cs7R123_58380 [Catellatospora sp. TT07R-123]|uniref:hypothetical protein n=1 Tax=Catellatospora sp. TT07R-123 TaxID=2733863 RepID=UPI001B2CB458|nr:hypothetical protein [Catellatospora sp. TT07R-123]GHJ48496.1 hypothetical protein Cs7R123_58380 [Catellatospora sp. TT07R-123]
MATGVDVDRHELALALLEAGQPPESFQLPGVHEHVPVPDECWFLRQAGPRWEIGAYGRGRYEVRESFDTEAAACACLFEVLVGAAPPE